MCIRDRLNTGDSIKRTGYSEGWSRVVYKDKECYVMSEFLSKEDPTGAGGENVMALENQPVQAGADGSAAANGRVVAIDAGHQAKGNSEKEPIGPGSSTMKAKVAAGAEGISTKLPEYKLTLSVSQKLRRILEERGYKVIMIRESNDVNLSNAERAEIANKSGASIFVRVHANSLDNNSAVSYTHLDVYKRQMDMERSKYQLAEKEAGQIGVDAVHGDTEYNNGQCDQH